MNRTETPPVFKAMVVSLLLALCAFTLAAVPSAGAEEAQAESTHSLTLMATTEVHAQLMPWDYYNDTRAEKQGLAKTFTLIEQARAEHDNTLLFDTGDILQGAFLGEYVAVIDPLEEGETHPSIAAMNLMGYDALTLGNHEFDFGLDFLEQTLADAKFPAISANVYNVDDQGEMTTPYVDPYVVINTEVDGIPLRVGVIGITPPGIVDWHSEKLDGRLDTIPAIEALERHLPQLQAQDVDLTVLSAHAGKNLHQGPDATINAQGENWLWSAAKQFSGQLDAIMFGHEQSVFPGDSKYDDVEGLDNDLGLIHGIPSVMAGVFGNHLGLVHLELSHDAGAWSVVSGQSEAIKVLADTVESSVIVDAVQEHHDATVAYIRSPVGETEVYITHYLSRVMDTKAVQLINEAQIWWAEQELTGTEHEDLPVLAAAAPFRAGRSGPTEYTYIAPGPVSIRELADLYLYPNQAHIVKLDGSQVVDWLEASAENFNQIDPDDPGEQELLNPDFPAYNFDVIDGIEYRVDVTKPLGERIVDATFEGAPLTADMEFAVVTNDYRAGGGGNFPHLDGSNTILATHEPNRAILVRYVSETTPITESADFNWSILPADVAGTVIFRSSPDAADYVVEDDIAGVSFIEERDDWGVFEYLFEDLTPRDAVVTRLFGSGRIQTAIDVSRHHIPDQAGGTVVLARADLYPDALAGAPLAFQLEAPILLTPSHALHGDTASELQRIGAEQVILLGGRAALSDRVAADVAGLGIEVDRVDGSNRFDTAGLIAARLDRTGPGAIIAEGGHPDPARGWPDPLSAAPLAAHTARPILLVSSGTLPGETQEALADLGITETMVVGGSQAVSEPVVEELASRGHGPQRVFGSTRYETSRAVYDASVAAGLDPDMIWIATGRNFPDALAAGPTVAAQGGTLILADGQGLEGSPPARQLLVERAATITDVILLGGTAAISDAVEAEIRAILR